MPLWKSYPRQIRLNPTPLDVEGECLGDTDPLVLPYLTTLARTDGAQI